MTQNFVKNKRRQDKKVDLRQVHNGMSITVSLYCLLDFVKIVFEALCIVNFNFQKDLTN